MPNVVTSQTILDGDRNVVILLTGTLDTSNESRVVKVDLSTLVPRPTRIRVDTIRHLVSNGLIVALDWDASTPVRFAALTGWDEVEACKFGGLQDNSGAGRTGNIALTTLGWTSGVLAYQIILEMTKTSFS